MAALLAAELVVVRVAKKVASLEKSWVSRMVVSMVDPKVAY